MHGRADIAFALALRKLNQSTIKVSSPPAKDFKVVASPSGESNPKPVAMLSLTIQKPVIPMAVLPLSALETKVPQLAVDVKESGNNANLIVALPPKDFKTNTNNIVLIFANCSAGQFGDYAQSGEIAYALNEHCKSTGASQQFVLVSSKDGIEKFKQLYLKNPQAQVLTIHGMSFGFAALEDFVLSGQSAQVSHFVKVTSCGGVDFDLVRRATNAKTKYFYLAAPWSPGYYASTFENGFLNEAKQGRVSSILMGAGSGRLGFNIFNGPIEALDHSAYFNVTTEPFAFAYFKNRGGCEHHQASFAGDFMQVAYRSTYKASNYVLIGDDYDIELGISKLIEQAPHLKVVMHSENKKSKLYCMRPTGVSYKLQQAGASLDEKDAVKVVALDRVPAEQMRSLMHASIPFVGVAGVMSMLEAFVIGKIPLFVYVRSNLLFYDQYREFLASAHSLGLNQQSVTLAGSLEWNQCVGFPADKLPPIVALLNDEKAVTPLQTENRRFAGTNATKGIYDALGISPAAGLAVPARTSDDKQHVPNSLVAMDSSAIEINSLNVPSGSPKPF